MTIATLSMPRPTIRGSGISVGISVIVGADFLDGTPEEWHYPSRSSTRKRAVTTTRSSSSIGVDVLDAFDGFDDGFKRFGNELNGIVRL